MTDPPDADAAASLARLVRDEGRVVLAILVRRLGDLGRAEDAVQDASLQALTTWSRNGVPPNPRAWFLTTARHRAIDRMRREASRSDREVKAMALLEGDPDVPTDSVVHDDLLRLVFTCCHPSLAQDAQVALSLHTLCGLSNAEVARALVTTESTMAKRLTRARQKIKLAAIPYRVPSDHELPDRLAAVTSVIYLVFNEGYAASSGDHHLRSGLTEEAIRLARLLIELLPGEASLQGLLALMLLQAARQRSRVDAHGSMVLLAAQDRTLWNRDLIAEGTVLVGEGLRRTPNRPDPYVIQAAIAACHALAPTYQDTDWTVIVSWYDVLLTVTDTPVVRLNRSAAVAGRDGPEVALTLVEAIDGLAHYPLWHSVQAELLAELGRTEDAARALRCALAIPMSAPLQRALTDRLDALARF